MLPYFMKMHIGMFLCNILPLNHFPACNIQDHKSLEITAAKLSLVSCLYRNTHRPTLPHGSGFLALHVNQTL